MKKLLLAPALMLAISSANAQLALQNFNAAGMPAGWSMINDGKTLSSSITPAYIIPLLNANAWTKFQKATGDSAMISTSYFATSATADRWLITPAFSVTSVNMVLSYMIGDLSSSGTSPVEIWVGPSTATVASDFTTKLSTYTCAAGLVKSGVGLGAYNGSTIKIAFRSVGKDKGFPAVDDVQTEIIPATEMSLLAVSPSLNSIGTYKTVGTGVTIQGLAQNNGSANITSFTAKYQVGASTPVSQVITSTITPFGQSVFTFTTPASVPALSNTNVKVWVELTGDAVHTNDTAKTNLFGVSKLPKKKMLIEEGTGTWCGFCVRGTVYMDSMEKMNANNVSLVAVHNSTSDPMQNAAYDAFVGNFMNTVDASRAGYPNALYDRIDFDDPAAAFDYYNQYKANFGFADMTVTPTLTGSSLTIKAVVTPALTITADYRLALALTEDGVTISGTQHNYYSDAYLTSHGATPGYYGSLKSSLYDFNSLPEYVASPPLIYNFVARGIYPSSAGAAGSLPASLTSGTPITYTFPAITLNSSWKSNKMKAVLMLINNADGTVLNTENVKINPTSVKEIEAGVNNVEIYPNPAKEIVTTKFSLTEQSNVAIEIVDMLGKVVKTVANKSLTAGTYEMTTNVSEMASGLYLVKITTDKGTVTDRLSVVK